MSAHGTGTRNDETLVVDLVKIVACVCSKWLSMGDEKLRKDLHTLRNIEIVTCILQLNQKLQKYYKTS